MSSDHDQLFPNEVPSDRHELKVPDGTGLDLAVSILQKEIRRGHELEAVYWSLQLQSYWRKLWYRLSVIAVEDIGFGDPLAIIIVRACATSYEAEMERRRKQKTGGRPEPDLIVHAVRHLCRASKSRENDNLKLAVEVMQRDGWRPEIPSYAVDVHTAEGRALYRDASAEEIDRLWFTEWSRVEPEVGPTTWRDWHRRRLGIESG